ncbi:MAG: hypothetical protein KIS92_26245 [Planctomycetota bacterium]|nr:hypothetical protein [Planctomycetota bacterium]
MRARSAGVWVCTLVLGLAAVTAEENKPVNTGTKMVTLDTLKDWTLPEIPAVKFDGALPIKDANGAAVKGRFDKDAIYVVNQFTGLRTYKPGDKWDVQTVFPDRAQGHYTFLIEKVSDAIAVRPFVAMTGNFNGKEFAILDANGNGRFDDSGDDVIVYDKKTAFKVGDKVKIGEDEWDAKVTASGNSVTWGKGMGFSTAFDKTKGDNSIDGGLALWNGIRASIGAPPVKRDPKLEEWGYKHIAYMKAVNNLQHPEEKDNPNFSEEGHKAGMGSCLGRGSRDPQSAIMGQLTCFLHRIPLINPELELTSFCVDPAGWSAFDHGNAPKRKFDWQGPLAYPPDGANDFGPYWSGNEGPCPIPGGPPEGGVGQPVTLTFAPRVKVTNGKMAITDASGAEVEGWLSAPDKPAVAMFGNNCQTICFIAKQPFKAKTTYTVKATAEVNGASFEKSWKFTTSDSNMPAWIRGGGGGNGGGRRGR